MNQTFFKIESSCGYHNEWFTSLGKAIQEARKLCGYWPNEEQGQAVTDIVTIYKCEVSLRKTQILDMLNHGGWHGNKHKLGECTTFSGLDLLDQPKPCFNVLNEKGTNV